MCPVWFVKIIFLPYFLQPVEREVHLRPEEKTESDQHKVQCKVFTNGPFTWWFYCRAYHATKVVVVAHQNCVCKQSGFQRDLSQPSGHKFTYDRNLVQRLSDGAARKYQFMSVTSVYKLPKKPRFIKITIKLAKKDRRGVQLFLHEPVWLDYPYIYTLKKILKKFPIFYKRGGSNTWLRN